MTGSEIASRRDAIDRDAVLLEAQAASPNAARRFVTMLEAVEEAQRVYRQAVLDDRDLDALIMMANAASMNVRTDAERINWHDFIASLERRQRYRRDAAETKITDLLRSFVDPFAIRRFVEADR